VSQNKKTYEESILRLEEISELLESGELSLDASMKLYEESVKLSDFCLKKLEEYKGKIKLVSENGEEDLQDE